MVLPTPGDALTFTQWRNWDTDKEGSLSGQAGREKMEQKGARYAADQAVTPDLADLAGRPLPPSSLHIPPSQGSGTLDPSQHPRACGGRTMVSSRFSSTEDYSWATGVHEDAPSSSKHRTSF